MLLIHLFESIDLDKTIAVYGKQLEPRIKTDHSAPKDLKQIVQMQTLHQIRNMYNG
jgi:hypothetical protein